MRCSALTSLLVLAGSPVAWADMALPIPGLSTVPCELEIEVPEDLNGFRIYLAPPGGPALELTPGTNRLFDIGDHRDPTGLLIAMPTRDVEFLDHGEPLGTLLSYAMSDRLPQPQVELRVRLHFLDMRSKVRASYRIDGVTSDGAIRMTTVHVDGGWTEHFCLATIGLFIAICLLFVYLEFRGRCGHGLSQVPRMPTITLTRETDTRGD